MASIPKVYVGDVGTHILVDMGKNIVGATNTSLRVMKPDGTTVTWDAAVFGTRHLEVVSELTTFDIPGLYKIYPKLTIGAWTGYGDPVRLEVESLER